MKPTFVASHQTALTIHRLYSIAHKTPQQVSGSIQLPPTQPKLGNREELTTQLISNVTDSLCTPDDSMKLFQHMHCLVGEKHGSYHTKQLSSHLFSHKPQPRHFSRLTAEIACTAVPLTFVEIAANATLIETIKLGCELCGTYRTLPGHATVYNTKPLADTRSLRKFIDRNSCLRGTQQVRRALPFIANYSASPAETQLMLALALPKRLGGEGLGTPEMNYELETTPVAFAACGKHHLRCDLFWPEFNLDVEYQSKTFHEGELSRLKDSRRTNALKSMGISTICVTNDELAHQQAFDAICASMANKLHVNPYKPKNFTARKRQLRRELGLPVGNEMPL